jgi:hypothetical protein
LNQPIHARRRLACRGRPDTTLRGRDRSIELCKMIYVNNFHSSLETSAQAHCALWALPAEGPPYAKGRPA